MRVLGQGLDGADDGRDEILGGLERARRGERGEADEQEDGEDTVGTQTGERLRRGELLCALIEWETAHGHLGVAG